MTRPYYEIRMRTRTHIVSASLICQTCGKTADTIEELAKMHQRSARVVPGWEFYPSREGNDDL